MEIWKTINEYEHAYQISNRGRVRSLNKTVRTRGNSTRVITGKILSPGKSDNGYLIVILYDAPRKKKICLIHQLVARAFIPNPHNKPEVNHKNGKKHDNHKSNLEWCTKKENHQHAARIGIKKNGAQVRTSKLTEGLVLEIRKLCKSRTVTDSTIAVKYGVDKSLIGIIKRNQVWKHVQGV